MSVSTRKLPYNISKLTPLKKIEKVKTLDEENVKANITCFAIWTGYLKSFCIFRERKYGFLNSLVVLIDVDSFKKK